MDRVTQTLNTNQLPGDTKLEGQASVRAEEFLSTAAKAMEKVCFDLSQSVLATPKGERTNNRLDEQCEICSKLEKQYEDVVAQLTPVSLNCVVDNNSIRAKVIRLVWIYRFSSEKKAGVLMSHTTVTEEAIDRFPYSVLQTSRKIAA